MYGCTDVRMYRRGTYTLSTYVRDERQDRARVLFTVVSSQGISPQLMTLLKTQFRLCAPGTRARLSTDVDGMFPTGATFGDETSGRADEPAATFRERKSSF